MKSGETDSIAPVETTGLWGHPHMRLLCDRRSARWRELLVRMSGIMDAAVGAARAASRGLILETTPVMHGSAVQTVLADEPGDIDIGLWIRFRLENPVRSLNEAWQATIDPQVAMIDAMLRSIADQPDMRFVRLATQANGALAEIDSLPNGLVCYWSRADLAIGSVASGMGEISLRRALLVSGLCHMTIALDLGAGDAVMIDLSLERSVVDPGEIRDVSVRTPAMWMGKVCASEAAARIALAMERELADLFPGRYDPTRIIWSSVTGDLPPMFETRRFVRAQRLVALWHALRGDEARTKAAAGLLPPEARAVYAAATRLGSFMQSRRHGDVDPDALRMWGRGAARWLVEAVSGCPGDWPGRSLLDLAKTGEASLAASDDAAAWARVNEAVTGALTACNDVVEMGLRRAPELLEGLVSIPADQ